MFNFVTNSTRRSLSTNIGIEIHALSSATKPLCSWIARDAIQDCREACGGYGYLKSNEILHKFMIDQFSRKLY